MEAFKGIFFFFGGGGKANSRSKIPKIRDLGGHERSGRLLGVGAEPLGEVRGGLKPLRVRRNQPETPGNRRIVGRRFEERRVLGRNSENSDRRVGGRSWEIETGDFERRSQHAVRGTADP